MNNTPLVSIIIPTKNEENNIEMCLKSIKQQTHKKIELIVIDNHSSDKTKTLARKYTKNIFNKGPERSAQRNFGAEKSRGEYLLFVDADMILDTTVIESCVRKCKSRKLIGLIIPEESFGKGFWAKCKKLEKSFYVGENLIEAPRFFYKKEFLKINGYDTKLISGEDWDLSERIQKLGKIGRIEKFIYHNEGFITLSKTIKKKFYYAKYISAYQAKDLKNNHIKKQMNILYRYRLFLSKPKKLFKNPILGLGMLFMKTAEFISGGFGMLLVKTKIIKI